MSDRLAKCLVILRAQVNEKFPSRRKDSDGWIGDASHQARSSDHNPWIKDGEDYVVSAIDITHCPEKGFDSYAFAEKLLLNQDPRVKYVISNHRIAAGKEGPAPWVWRKYSGSNPHDHHVHISVLPDKELYDDPTPWLIGGVVLPSPQPREYRPPPPTLKRGSTGANVKVLQKALSLKDDGVFGPMTEAAVQAIQKKSGLVEDGIVGPQTWKVIAPLVKVA